jgi:hypothetical protein
MFKREWGYHRLAALGLLLGAWLSQAPSSQAQPGTRARFGTPSLSPDNPPAVTRISFETPQSAPNPEERATLLPPVPHETASPSESCPKAADQKQEDKQGEDKKDGDKKESETCKSFWQTHPKYPVQPKMGFWIIPPTGPGYYSAKDVVTNNYRQGPPPFGYNRYFIFPFPFFDSDFGYVDDPKKNKDVDFFEKLHRIHLGYNDNWLFGTGGEFRYRMFNEINSRGTGIDNRYDLTRLRLFGDLWYRDTFRLYIEGFSAQSFNQNLKPLAIDRDYLDFLNLFIDLKVFQDDSGVPWYVRGGRQQLAFGSQRLISNLNWANAERTFEGVRAFRHSEKFDVDMFWAQPVVPNVTSFDSVDRGQNFAGLWTTYRPNKNTNWDLYYLFLDNTNKYTISSTSKFPGPITSTPYSSGALAIDGPYNVHTLGTRFNGDYNNFLYDWEPMLQLGRRGSSDIIAGASASGIGWHFKDAPWNPVLWAYYDWASGSRNPLAGQLSTFNQLYPFGHYYFGWMDFVGRQNIQDYNLNLYLNPNKWITINPQYHVFQLSSATDALYNAAGQPLRFDPTGRSGKDVGQEMDWIVNLHMTRHQDIMFAYGHFFFGEFMRNTGPGTGAETYWLMYNVRW